MAHPAWGGHAQILNLSPGPPQGPHPVVDVAAPHTSGPRGSVARAGAVEAVALGEEILQRPGPGIEALTRRAIKPHEPGGRRRRVGPYAPVTHLLAADLTGHIRVEVG